MKAYLDLLKEVIADGEGHADRTKVGTRSLFGRTFRHRMQTGFPILTTKKMPMRWIAEELFWFLSGSTNELVLREKGVDIWKEWADEDGNLGPVYGKQFRDFNGVDQLNEFVVRLAKDPGSRRHVMTLWNPVDIPNMALPCCHGIVIQARIHDLDGSISLHMYQRSADILLGVPFNISSYGLFLEMLGFALNRPTRELIMTFGDLHLYSNHLDAAKEQIARAPYPLPKLTIHAETKPDRLDTLLGINWESIKVDGYKCHAAIKAAVAV